MIRSHFRRPLSAPSTSSCNLSLDNSRRETSSAQSEMQSVFIFSQTEQQQQYLENNRSGNLQDINGGLFNQQKTRCSMSEEKQELEARVTKLEQRATRIEGDVADIKKDVAEVKNDVAEVKKDVAKVKKNVAKIMEILEKNFPQCKIMEPPSGILAPFSIFDRKKRCQKHKTKVMYIELLNFLQRKGLFLRPKKQTYKFIYLSFFVMEAINFSQIKKEKMNNFLILILELTSRMPENDEMGRFQYSQSERSFLKKNQKKVQDANDIIENRWLYDQEKESIDCNLVNFQKQIKKSLQIPYWQIYVYLIVLRLNEMFQKNADDLVAIIVACAAKDQSYKILHNQGLLTLIPTCKSVKQMVKELEKRVEKNLPLD